MHDVTFSPTYTLVTVELSILLKVGDKLGAKSLSDLVVDGEEDRKAMIDVECLVILEGVVVII